MHIILRFHFLTHLLLDNVISLEYVQSEHCIADFLAKAVNKDRLVYSMKYSTIISSFDTCKFVCIFKYNFV